jgi:succinate dehydrogenase / fumarate reductase cytochrome b subunit
MAVEQHDIPRTRPVNLNLMTIKFPVPAIASILHRISGLLLFIFIPFLLWALQTSLDSSGSYQNLITYLSNPLSKFIIWVFIISFTYHLFAGIRHLVQDFGLGESLKASRMSAYIVMILTLVVAICIGVWLW